MTGSIAPTPECHPLLAEGRHSHEPYWFCAFPAGNLSVVETRYRVYTEVVFGRKKLVMASTRPSYEGRIRFAHLDMVDFYKRLTCGQAPFA